MKSTLSEYENCPNCEEPKHLDLSECPHCGVVYKKVLPNFGDEGPQAQIDLQLVEVWQDLLSDYTNKEKHDLFLQMSLSKNKLPFASQQYRKLLEIDANDQMAKQMQQKILQLATISMMSQKRSLPERKKSWMSFMLSLLALVFCLIAFMTKVPELYMAGGVFFLLAFITKSVATKYT